LRTAQGAFCNFLQIFPVFETRRETDAPNGPKSREIGVFSEKIVDFRRSTRYSKGEKSRRRRGVERKNVK
jgi:hypothetical protein